MEPKVTLLTWTNYPIETVYSVWEASKTEAKLRTPKQISEQVSKEELMDIFTKVIAQKIPVGEHIDFVFMLEGISVSLREQIVRHRIGTLPSPERIGADITMDRIPDLANSSWWSQSMRIQDMGSFATERKYRIPDSLLDENGNDRIIPHGFGEMTGDSALMHYGAVMHHIELVYKALVAAGVPMEDAREIIPLGAQHRISWKLNMSALQHIVEERGCWILQLGIWEPIITGMISELSNKINPIFSELVSPPCMHGDKYTGCVYQEECNRRLDGRDKLPPCPIHLYHEIQPEVPFDIPMYEEMETRAHKYEKFWRRDPYRGNRLKTIEKTGIAWLDNGNASPL
jgi:hypothetical protein